MSTPAVTAAAAAAGAVKASTGSSGGIHLERAVNPMKHATKFLGIFDRRIGIRHRPEECQGVSIFFTAVFVERHGQMVNDSAECIFHPS
jgi:hypothetical protein